MVLSSADCRFAADFDARWQKWLDMRNDLTYAASAKDLVAKMTLLLNNPTSEIVNSSSRFGRGYSALAIGLTAAVLLGGCTRTSDPNQNRVLPTTQNPARSLRPAPLTPVQETQLNPITPTVRAPAVPSGSIPAIEQPVIARADPSVGAKPVSRQAMIGAWTMSTGGNNCQIFLALTKWSGGYRAASRGCSAAAISDVQAWDVHGKQVVLVESSGSTAATLYRSSDTRFDGSTKNGDAISFSR